MSSKQPIVKTLLVKKIELPNGSPLKDIALSMEALSIGFQTIDVMNWKEFAYKPNVQFRIAYSESELFLQYCVSEKYIVADCDLNDPSCWPAHDSCVEFFVSPESDSSYSNFEFSCIGYCLFQAGKQGEARDRKPSDQTRLVRRESSLGTKTFSQKEGNFDWTLTIAIPLSLISTASGEDMSGKAWRANFYKCGDGLKEKHYLSWSPIDLPSPNFHCPSQFGILKFE